MARKIDLRAALWAAAAAGIVFMMLEMAMVMLVQGESPWAPPRMIAAIGMGEGVLPPPATFDAGIMAVAMAIHFALAIVLAIILAWVISRFGLGTAASVVGGAAFGLAVYYINFYGFTALFPWFAMARGAISIVAHAVFGAILGAVYRLLHPRSGEDSAEAGERVA